MHLVFLDANLFFSCRAKTQGWNSFSRRLFLCSRLVACNFVKRQTTARNRFAVAAVVAAHVAMEPNKEECIGKGITAMGAAMDAKPEDVSRIFTLVTQALPNLASRSILVLAPLASYNRYSLLQTSALSLKETGATIAVVGMEEAFMASGFKAAMDSKLLASTPADFKPDLMIILSDPADAIVMYPETPFLTTTTFLNKVGATAAFKIGSFAVGTVHVDEDENVNLPPLPSTGFVANSLYLHPSGHILKMFRISGVGGDVVVRQMHVYDDEYFASTEFTINLRRAMDACNSYAVTSRSCVVTSSSQSYSGTRSDAGAAAWPMPRLTSTPSRIARPRPSRRGRATCGSRRFRPRGWFRRHRQHSTRHWPDSGLRRTRSGLVCRLEAWCVGLRLGPDESTRTLMCRLSGL